MTTVVVVGSSGMLGHALVGALGDHDLRALTRAEANLTNQATLEQVIPKRAVVINAAAYTDVDAAETHRDEAFAVNAEGVRHLAEVVKAREGRLIHISTDYVFDGTATMPYSEDSPRSPRSAYGASKARGEEYVQEILPDTGIIARTAWLYGLPGSSFARTILTLGKTRESLDVVNDQIGQPTSTLDVARMIKALVASDIHSGIFHATNSGNASWYDFAQRLFSLAGWDPKRITPVTSEAFPRPASRPIWSVLGHEAWTAPGLPTPRNWRDALDEAWSTGFDDLVLKS
jgi:dTDP-4-dehydrorhamnose reductase